MATGASTVSVIFTVIDALGSAMPATHLRLGVTLRVRDDSYLNLNLYCSNNVVEYLHLQVDGFAT